MSFGFVQSRSVPVKSLSAIRKEKSQQADKKDGNDNILGDLALPDLGNMLGDMGNLFPWASPSKPAAKKP